MLFLYKILQQTQFYKHLKNITKFFEMKTSKPLLINLSFSSIQLNFWDTKFKIITYTHKYSKLMDF